MKQPASIASEKGLRLLQFATRAVFALLVAFYFADHPEQFKPLPPATVWVLAGLYLLLHGLLLYRPIAAGPPLAVALDLLFLGGLLIPDPGTPPPLLALLAVAVLAGGVVHGLSRFFQTLGAVALVLVPVLFLRTLYREEPVDMGTLFLLAVLAVCLLYFGVLLYRNRLLAAMAQEATWTDRETGLLSHEALIHTGGWLLPLHDRMSDQLTAVLLATEAPGGLRELTERIHQRLRRSDVAARFDEHSLALLLPCTEGDDAVEVLAELQQRVPGLRGARLTLNEPDIALEEVLEHLRHTLERARPEEGHWLVQATQLSH